jgi:hypothetical protein
MGLLNLPAHPYARAANRLLEFTQITSLEQRPRRFEGREGFRVLTAQLKEAGTVSVDHE